MTPPAPATMAVATVLSRLKDGISAEVTATARTLACRLASLVRRNCSMFSPSRLKAWASRTPAMLSCKSALTSPMLSRDCRKACRARSERNCVTTSMAGTTSRLKKASATLSDHHGHHDPDQREQAGNDAHQAEVDRLVDRVHVIGQPAHHVAGLVLGEVADAQAVHLVEGLVAHGPHHALADVGHEQELQAATHGVDHGHDHHQRHHHHQPAQVRRRVADSAQREFCRRSDEAVDGLARQEGAGDLGDGAKDDEDRHTQQCEPVRTRNSAAAARRWRENPWPCAPLR